MPHVPVKAMLADNRRQLADCVIRLRYTQDRAGLFCQIDRLLDVRIDLTRQLGRGRRTRT